MKIEIKHRYINSVLFAHECEENSLKITLTMALKASANLGEDTKLLGDRPFMQLGPIGSRSDYLLAFLTTKGVILKAGCFTGCVAEFEAKLGQEHVNNKHVTEYRAALVLVKAHAEIWTPKEGAGNEDS